MGNGINMPIWDEGERRLVMGLNIEAVLNEDNSVDLEGKQGCTWEISLELKDGDGNPFVLTGYSCRGQIRRNYNSTSPTANFTCDIIPPYTDGKIKISLADDITAAIPRKRYVYDIEIESSDGKTSRILEGKLYIDPEATK